MLRMKSNKIVIRTKHNLEPKPNYGIILKANLLVFTPDLLSSLHASICFLSVQLPTPNGSHSFTISV